MKRQINPKLKYSRHDIIRIERELKSLKANPSAMAVAMIKVMERLLQRLEA